VRNNQILTLIIPQGIDAINRWIDSILKSEKIKRLNRVNTIKVQGFSSLYNVLHLGNWVGLKNKVTGIVVNYILLRDN